MAATTTTTPGTPRPFVKSASARESSVLALIAGGAHPHHPLLAEGKGCNGSTNSINSNDSFPSMSDGPASPRHNSGMGGSRVEISMNFDVAYLPYLPFQPLFSSAMFFPFRKEMPLPF